jgi:hypothetical protein
MESKQGVGLEKLTRVYLKIKAKRSELAAKFKDTDGDLQSQQEAIKKALLDHCKEHEVESVRTSEGLFYRTVKTRYWTSDWDSMYKFIAEQEVPEFLEKRLNQGNVPPGLNVDSEYIISVRKK